LEEGVDGCQADIPRARAVFASAFQVIEEETDEGSIEVFDPELAGAFAELLFGELQKETKAIAISCDGVRARLSLAKQTIGKERLKKRGKAGGNHRPTSR
jgi:hypothetical protein